MADKGITMKGVLRSLFSMDVLEGLQNYTPSDPENFGIRVQAFVGPPDSEDRTSFDLRVCTPSWLDANLMAIRSWEFEGLFGRGMLFMKRWNYSMLYQMIAEILDDIEGPDWQETAMRISRWIPWEYEYRIDRDTA